MTALLVCMKCDYRTQCEEKKKRVKAGYGIWGGKVSKKGVDHA
jgi:hypothetical protein